MRVRGAAIRWSRPASRAAGTCHDQEPQRSSHRDPHGVAVRVPPLAQTALARLGPGAGDGRRNRLRPVHAAVCRQARRRHRARRDGFRRSKVRRDFRVRRHHRARARADHVPSLRPVGHRAVHTARDERHCARRVPPGAALLHRLACEQLCRLDGAQGHARHVGGRLAERHDPAGAVAVGGGAGRICDPVRPALAGARHRRRHRRGRLHRHDDHAVDAVHRAGGAAVERVGHQGRRRARRRA